MAALNSVSNPQCSGEFTEYTGNSNPVTVAAWYRNVNIASVLATGITPIFTINNQLSSVGSRILLAISGNNSPPPGSKVYIFDVLSTPLSGNYIPSSMSNIPWTHLCGVITSATDRKFYENGIEIRSNTTSVTVNSGIMCSILSLYQNGAWNAGTSHSTSSQIGDIGVWNTNLTSGEVYSLSRGFTCEKIRPQNLVLYMPMMASNFLQDITNNRSFTKNSSFLEITGVVPIAPALY